MTTDKRRARLIDVIASKLNLPNVFMGGPSPGAKIRAADIYDAIRTSDEAAVDERWHLVDRICRTVFPDFDHWPDRTAHHGMRHTVFRALAATESDNG